MKCVLRVSISLLVPFITLAACAQERPVRWNCFARKVADKKYELHLIAFIDSGWHIYSCNQPKYAIGLPTTISITTNPLLLFPGKLLENGTLHKVVNKELDTEDYQYTGKVDFVRVVNLRENAKTEIAGSIEFMACTGERCMPRATVNFRLPIN